MNRPAVLLLDDSPAVHERVRKAFDGQPVELEATDSWVDAKARLLERTPPDLLILDLQMPTIDGRTFGRVIKRRLPMPIVVYSSETAQHIAEAVAYVGAEGGVSKSAPDEELVRQVMVLLGRARDKTAADAARPEAGGERAP